MASAESLPVSFPIRTCRPMRGVVPVAAERFCRYQERWDCSTGCEQENPISIYSGASVPDPWEDLDRFLHPSRPGPEATPQGSSLTRCFLQPHPSDMPREHHDIFDSPDALCPTHKLRARAPDRRHIAASPLRYPAPYQVETISRQRSTVRPHSPDPRPCGCTSAPSPCSASGRIRNSGSNQCRSNPSVSPD
ncbi:hypothetical protein R70006_08304 [Paraburkholderia domus]|nr:hypothetical protein R70006_08304 [Paraburkholderia domus]